MTIKSGLVLPSNFVTTSACVQSPQIRPCSEQPNVTEARSGMLRRRRHLIGAVVIFGITQKVVDLSVIEAGERKIEVEALEVGEFQCQEFLVPFCPAHRTVHQQPERLYLRSVHSSQRITGTSAMPSFLAAFNLRWPSTTVPSLRASTGTLKPNSLMDATMRSTAASFLRGLRT